IRPSSVRENGTPRCSSSMTAGIASRHMYSIASWSPSQSEPLTVSYMCQRQSSGPMLPSAAEMPPCAATVCERVGNTLEMQAVLKPASAQPTLERRTHAVIVPVHEIEHEPYEAGRQGDQRERGHVHEPRFRRSGSGGAQG